MEDIVFRRASVGDAALLAATRKKAWDATYRGIYPDEMIDGYDLQQRTERDRQRIADPEQLVWFAMDGDICAGFVCLGPFAHGTYKDFRFCLNALYFLPPYQHRGLGRKAFEITQNECRRRGFDKFFCGCNAHNVKARAFYEHMGGVLGKQSLGHGNPAEDQVYYEFYLGDAT